MCSSGLSTVIPDWLGILDGNLKGGSRWRNLSWDETTWETLFFERLARIIKVGLCDSMVLLRLVLEIHFEIVEIYLWIELEGQNLPNKGSDVGRRESESTSWSNLNTGLSETANRKSISRWDARSLCNLSLLFESLERFSTLGWTATCVSSTLTAWKKDERINGVKHARLAMIACCLTAINPDWFRIFDLNCPGGSGSFGRICRWNKTRKESILHWHTRLIKRWLCNGMILSRLWVCASAVTYGIETNLWEEMEGNSIAWLSDRRLRTKKQLRVFSNSNFMIRTRNHRRYSQRQNERERFEPRHNCLYELRSQL